MSAKLRTRHDNLQRGNFTIPQIDVAWQRIEVVVPSFWSITTVSGDDYCGSVRIERTGDDAGSFSPFGIDIRWSGKVKTAQTAEMLDKRIKPLITAGIKLAKKSGGFSKPEISAVDSPDHPERGSIREYSWSGQPATVGRIWRCATCGRLLVAQVQGIGNSKFYAQAKAILESISCHNRIEGWTRWALYGVDVDVPEKFGLVKHQLMTTYLELRFGRMHNGLAKSVGETITVEQWSAANVQLKGMYVDEWIERKSNALLATTKIDKHQTEINGHEALQMTGKRVGPGFWLDDAAKALLKFSPPASHYDALAWECPESNKVYLVQHIASQENTGIAKKIAERVRCHDSIESSA